MAKKKTPVIEAKIKLYKSMVGKTSADGLTAVSEIEAAVKVLQDKGFAVVMHWAPATVMLETAPGTSNAQADG